MTQVSLLVAVLLTAEPKDASMTARWFRTRDCTALELIKYKSSSEAEVIKSVRLEDRAAIQKLIARIEQLPVDGDMMKSFGPDAPHLDLVFTCGSRTQTIETYRGRFKTPSTGFNSDSDTSEREAALTADLEGLLFPEVSKKLLLVENLELRFKDFSLVYKGSRSYKPSEQETVSFTERRFLIKDSTAEREVTVTSGQLPPKPVPLTVNKLKLTLVTFQTKSGDRLYPDYFQVTK